MSDLLGVTFSVSHARYLANRYAVQAGASVMVLLTSAGFALLTDLSSYTGPRGTVVYTANPDAAEEWLVKRPHLSALYAQRLS